MAKESRIDPMTPRGIERNGWLILPVVNSLFALRSATAASPTHTRMEENLRLVRIGAMEPGSRLAAMTQTGGYVITG